MNTKELQQKLHDLESARSRLHELKNSRAALDFKGHQIPMSATVGDVKLVVSKSTRTYMQEIKPGCDMIVLGFKRVFNEYISNQQAKIEELESQIRTLASYELLEK